jgi:hypothetical protein
MRCRERNAHGCRTIQRGDSARADGPASSSTVRPQPDRPSRRRQRRGRRNQAPEELFGYWVRAQQVARGPKSRCRRAHQVDRAFTDPRLCAAIADRLTFAGNIIEALCATNRRRPSAVVAGDPSRTLAAGYHYLALRRPAIVICRSVDVGHGVVAAGEPRVVMSALSALSFVCVSEPIWGSDLVRATVLADGN